MIELAIEPVDPYDDDEAALRHEAYEVRSFVGAHSDLATTIHEPVRAYQWGALVRRADRGHRLGLAVKVANLRLLQQERPDIERVITWNGEEQQPHGAGQRRAGVSGRGSDG